MVTMPYEEDKLRDELAEQDADVHGVSQIPQSTQDNPVIVHTMEEPEKTQDSLQWAPDPNTPTINADTGMPYWVEHIKSGHWSTVLRRIRNEYVGKKDDQEELDKMIQFMEELV